MSLLHRFIPRFLLILAGFAVIISPVFTQVTIKGEVVDGKTLKPLIFVNIIESGKGNGTVSDIDGNFRFTVSALPATITFSYVGYRQKTIIVTSLTDELRVILSADENELNEVTVMPGENPADKIIRRLIERRDTLNPKKLHSFSYTTYNKLIFTSEQDTSKGEVYTGIFGTVDSSEIKAREFFNQQHLFINESVTERKFRAPDHSFENVIASRTSGLKDPIISSLTTQLQSLSFYEEYFDVLNFKYLNPLSEAGPDHYYYQIEDTTFSGSDTIIVISFHPKSGKKFEALEGVLNINMKYLALETARAEAFKKEDFYLRILHKYQVVDSLHWFPVQLNTDLTLNNFKIGRLKLKAEGRSYIYDINVNPDLKRREFGAIEVEVDDKAMKNADTLLRQFRYSELTSKDSVTYRVIDSLGEKFNIMKRIDNLMALADGKLRIKFIDIDLTRIFTYNNYEGVRLGAGLGTNERLLKWFQFGGYFAYGFSDNAIKYGAWGEFRVHRKTDTRFRFDYKQDLVESGLTEYPMEGPLQLDNIYRSYVLGRFDSLQLFEGSVRFRPVQNLHVRFAMNHQIINPVLPYRFLPDTTVNPVYHFTEMNLTLRWGIKEKYIAFGDRYISMGNKYPVVWFHITQSVPGIGGQFSYTKLMAKIEQTFDWNKFGKTKLTLSGGYIFGDAPYTKLFNERGSYATFSFVARTAFETMRPNEFASDAFVSFFFSQGTGTLFKVKKWMKPELVLVHNMGFGWLRDPQRHDGVGFKTMEKGYFEAGLVLDKFITINVLGLGAGVFYRYGAYSSSYIGANFHVKMALSFSF